VCTETILKLKIESIDLYNNIFNFPFSKGKLSATISSSNEPTCELKRTREMKIRESGGDSANFAPKSWKSLVFLRT
jgi:hypothetical protein